MEEKTKETGTREERLLATAHKRFADCESAESDMRSQCLDDLLFLAGEQWDVQALNERTLNKRPALVINRMDQFVQHIANAQRQNRVSARVFPVDDQADVDTAEVRQGLIRHIEYQSNAAVAYHTAAFYAIAMGFGYFRLNTEYSDPLTFEQDIKIERIENPFNVYLAPHTQPDGSDAEFGFIFTDMTKEQYRAAYPKGQLAGANDMRSIGDSDPNWIGEDMVRVAEYFYTEYRHAKLVRLQDGTARLQEELTDADAVVLDGDGQPEVRDTRIPTVRWCKFNAVEILEETVWPIPQIPIIKVTGHELNVDGQRILKGIVRNLKDAQRQYNFMLSAQTEAVDASKGQVVMYEGQAEGHEAEWQNPNVRKVLQVKPETLDGKVVGLPQRLAPNMSIPAMTEARLLASDDLKALAGIYDSALGAQSNETSGLAIGRRVQQSDTANFHFQDNLTVSITHATRMIVDMQTVIYDTPRVVRIIGEDDAHKLRKINQDFQDGGGPVKRYDFSTGKYDVICTAGPSFATKRKEAAELLVQLSQTAPIIMNAAPDLVMKAIDVPYAQEISERLRKTLPPNLRDEPEGRKEVPPEVQQKMAQMGQMLEALTQQLDQATEVIKTKKLELDSKERIEMAKLEMQRQELEARLLESSQKLDSTEAIALLKAEVDAMKAQMGFDAQSAAVEAGAGAARM